MSDTWARTLPAGVAGEVGYRLHRLGLNGGTAEVTPGYARAEHELRRSMRLKLPPAVPWRSVREALAADAVIEGTASDRPWYQKRLEAGEGREAAALAEAVGAIDTEWRPPSAVAFVTSPALRALPFGVPSPRPECGGMPLVALGPKAPAELALLGAVALGVSGAVRAELPLDLDPEVAHFVEHMVAGTVLVNAGVAPAALDAILIQTTRALIPPQHRGGVLESRIRRLQREDLIDQPPGEIDRTIHGLSRRRADRLLRAWQRGFFLPPGLTLSA